MTLFLYFYLAGFAAHVILAHGILSNPNHTKEANPPSALLGAAVWPLLALVYGVKVIHDFQTKLADDEERGQQ